MTILTIVTSGDRRDRELARRIGKKIGILGRVEQVALDELVSLSETMRGARLMGRIPIFILSRSAVSTPKRRQVLATANPELTSSEFRSYYIVRGEQAHVLLDEYSDLEPLRVAMLVTARELDLVLQDISQYVTSSRTPGLRSTAMRLVRGGAIYALKLLNFVLLTVRAIPGMAAPVLIALIVLISLNAGREWRALLGLVCVAAPGFVMGKVQTLDLWPWLCGGTERDVALSRFRSVLRNTRIVQALLLSPIVVVAWWLIQTEHVPPWWIAAAVALGIFVELASTAILRIATPLTLANRGISSRHEINALHMYQRSELPNRLASLEDQRATLSDRSDIAVRRLMKVATLGAFAPHRSWLPVRDRVFISYAWNDDRDRRVTTAIVETLAAARVPYFIDTAKESEFLPWRPTVARELARATHVLLVISPDMGRGKTLLLELASIVARWYYEALPSVICIGDDDVIERVLDAEEVPVQLWFMLRWCPRLSHAEARNPALLAEAIAKVRRNGRWKDWVELLSPSAH